MKRYKILKPVHPNAGIEAEYRAKLDRLVREMSASYVYFLKAQYRETPPHMALDATPAKELQRELSLLGKRWQARIDAAAPKLAEWFTRSASNRSQAALKKILRDGGMSVEFRMTAPMRDVLQATLAENVSLIKSIGSEYHTEVEGIVMRSVTAGRNLSDMTNELEARYPITRKRAALISLDQNNKATSNFVKVRQADLGLKAKWLHSHGGKEPRPTHVDNSGKLYDPAKGWFDPDPKVRRRIWPGELIRCRCVSVSVVPGFS
jgi:uncharacterized protein with gpF-like domain